MTKNVNFCFKPTLVILLVLLLNQMTIQGEDKMAKAKPDEITLENKYVKVTVSSGGAIITHLWDKLQKREDVKMLPYVGGINEVRNYDGFSKRTKSRRIYRLDKRTLPDGSQKLTAVTDVPDKGNVTVTKEYLLPKDSSCLQVALEIRNNGTKEVGEIPWVRHLLNRGKKQQPEEAHMTEYGAFVTGKPLPSNPKVTHYEGTHFFPAANWTSRVVMPIEDGSDTLATILKPQDVLKIYNWHRSREDFCTQEVIAAPIFVDPGKSTRWEYCIVLTAPVRNIVYCSPALTIGVSPHATWLAPETKDLTLTLASSEKLDNIKMTYEIVSLEDKKPVVEGKTLELSTLHPEKTCKQKIPVALSDKTDYQLRLRFSQNGKPYYPGKLVDDTEPVTIPLVVGRRSKPGIVFEKSEKCKNRLRHIEPRTLKAKQVLFCKAFDAYAFPSAQRCFRKDTFEPSGKGVPQMFACAGEYESIQIVLQPREAAKPTWQVKASNLTGPGGAEVICESVNKFLYVPTKIPSLYNALFPVGDYPEALLPTNSFELDKTGNTPVFVTYRVPEGCPPGQYRGALTLANGTEQHEIPVEMTVWNIKMPKSLQNMEVASSLKGDTIPFARDADGKPLSRKEQRDAIVDMHLKYRLTPCDSGVANLLLAGKYEDFEKEMQKFIDAGATKIFLGNTWKVFKVARDRLPEIEEYLKKKGWHHYFYVRPGFDEASIDLVPEMKKACQEWKKVSSIPIMETYYHDQRADELFGCLDIWSRNLPAPKWAKERMAAGDRFWKVNAMPGIMEMPPWSNGRRRYIEYWDNHFTGTYVWTVKNWRDIKDWKGDDFWADSGVGNLSASLMWPHESGILSTIRLEAMRDGLEDNALLWLLRDKYNAVKSHGNLSTAQKEAIRQAKEICDSGPLFDRINSVEDLESLRLKAGNTLSDLNTLFPPTGHQ